MGCRVASLFPDPGPLPSQAAPLANERIVFQVAGFPPDKDLHFSIRNPRHKRHQRFKDLRTAAIAAMSGRARYLGPVELNVVVSAPNLDLSLIDYMSGIMDTLDGAHAPSFTYLPIVYQDDCQVVSSHFCFKNAANAYYDVEVVFLDDGQAIAERSPD
jgi:hypothetical protein